jgi:hypothetical protein
VNLLILGKSYFLIQSEAERIQQESIETVSTVAFDHRLNVTSLR